MHFRAVRQTHSLVLSVVMEQVQHPAAGEDGAMFGAVAVMAGVAKSG